MPRRSSPVAMTDHPSTQAPKKKRRAAGKFASTAARKRTKAKTKASQRGVIQPLLQLPAPRPLLLLTYVGPSQQIGSSAIAIDLSRPIKNPSAPQIVEPRSKIDDAVGCDIPSGCLPAAVPDDTLTQAPKQKKHSVARKTAGKLERRQKIIKTKSSPHVPTPPRLPTAPQIRLPLLSGVGDQNGSSASTINLVRSIAQPSAPQLAHAEPQPVDAGRYHQSAPSSTRPAGTTETSEGPRGSVPPRVHRAYSIDSRVVAKVSFTAAVIGAVLLLVRLPPLKPNDAIVTHELPPAETMLIQDIGAPGDAADRAAAQEASFASLAADRTAEQDATFASLAADRTAGQQVTFASLPVDRTAGQQATFVAADRTAEQRATFASLVAATEVKLTEVSTLAGLDSIQPFTVAFSDHPDGQPADPATGLIAFDNWAATRPAQKYFLSPFPDYTEKVLSAGPDGGKKPTVEKLHMYVAEARFVIAKSPQAIDLSQYVSIDYLEGIDAAIKHHLISPGEADNSANPNPARRWCEPQASVLCIKSRYRLEGKLPSAIQLLNQITSGKKIADYLEFQSELRAVPVAELDQKGLAKLTGLDMPVTGLLEETIFHVNQIMQFGKFLVLLQQDTADPNRTVATAVIALALKSRLIEKQKRFEDVPVLHNLVPAQLLTGRSTFNTGTSISAGLPLYARSNIKAVAATFERK
jgi:hypothetical protein